MSFDSMLQKVINSEETSNIPILYIVHLMVVLNDMGYLKEEDDDYVPYY